MSALPLASARFSLNDILDRDLCKISFISIFSLFSGLQTWFYQMR